MIADRPAFAIAGFTRATESAAMQFGGTRADWHSDYCRGQTFIRAVVLSSRDTKGRFTFSLCRGVHDHALFTCRAGEVAKIDSTELFAQFLSIFSWPCEKFLGHKVPNPKLDVQLGSDYLFIYSKEERRSRDVSCIKKSNM